MEEEELSEKKGGSISRTTESDFGGLVEDDGVSAEGLDEKCVLKKPDLGGGDG